jgi:hypothetical protein
MKISIKNIKDIIEIGQKVLNMTSKGSSSNNTSSKRSEFVESESSPTISEDMTPEEEDELIEKTRDKLSGCSLDSPAEVLSTIKAFTEAATDAVKFCEVQETKREEIRANRDARIKQLEAQRDIILNYLDRSFDERRYLFEKHFKIVDHALMTGNTEELTLSLQTINDLAKSSPFKALADLGNVQNTLNKPNSTFDI